MSAPILFDGVWKKFRRGEHHDSLRDLVPSMARRMFKKPAPAELDGGREFWAVSDVAFEVQPGEALAVIGPNGAGKSTILKLLTRILRPTRGRCDVKGRIGALIEVAAGFHPDLTGRENVFLQGAILGMKRAEIQRKFDQIVEFAGVGEFIDTPVKRFSSGMNARLGFAIAANLDPDVLIIDEVLSVGDTNFQARCVSRMRELIARGVPLVFVSHNLPAVLDLCNRAILINRGQLIFSGSAADTVQHYRRTSIAPRAIVPRSDIWIHNVRMLDPRAEVADLFQSGAPMRIRVEYETVRPVDNPSFAVDIHRDGLYCCGISTQIDGQSLGLVSGKGHVDLEIDALHLTAGCYAASVGIHRAGGIGSGGGIGTYDVHLLAYPFTVVSDRDSLGVIALPHRWQHARPGDPPGLRLHHSTAGPGQTVAAAKEVAVR